jgi:rubrerythrin
VSLADALHWLSGKSPEQALQLAMGLEVNAYDRYRIMSRDAADDESRDGFAKLAREEKAHLGLISDELDRWLEKRH